MGTGIDNSIGTAIAMLQAKLQLKGPAIALLALGPNATANERQTFLNRLSKIKRSEEGAESPSVPTLEKIARGFGYDVAAGFFYRARPDGSAPPTTKSQTNSLRQKKGRVKVPDGKSRRPASSERDLFLGGATTCLIDC